VGLIARAASLNAYIKSLKNVTGCLHAPSGVVRPTTLFRCSVGAFFLHSLRSDASPAPVTAHRPAPCRVGRSGRVSAPAGAQIGEEWLYQCFALQCCHSAPCILHARLCTLRGSSRPLTPDPLSDLQVLWACSSRQRSDHSAAAGGARRDLAGQRQRSTPQPSRPLRPPHQSTLVLRSCPVCTMRQAA
jgi:hypothetical protein